MRASSQHGFALIEVVVSAALVVAVSTGALAAFDGASHASGNARARSEAQALAQQDQERLRALSPTQLASFTTQTQSLTEGANTFTVVSSAQWRSDPSPTPTCAGDPPTDNYLQLTSNVTSPAMPGGQKVQLDSLVAVPKAPTGGTVVVQVQNRSQSPLSGATVTLAGTRSATALTSAAGCVLWTNVPAGTDTVTVTYPGGVDVDGNTSITKTITVSAQSTSAVGPVMIDVGGTAQATFQTKVGTTTYSGGSWDRITVSQAGMSVGTRSFGTSGSPATAITTGLLFPFTTSYGIYAGDCTANNPGASADQVTIAPGASNTPVVIHMPPVDVTVQQSTTGRTWSNALGANVSFTENDAGCTARKTGPFATNSSGKPIWSFPALPWGQYTVCAEYNFAGTWHYTTQSIAYRSLTSTPATLQISARTSPTGRCP